MFKDNNDKMQQFEKQWLKLLHKWQGFKPKFNNAQTILPAPVQTPIVQNMDYIVGLMVFKSIECKKKKAGHKDEVTLENRMGGSEKGINRRNN